MFRKIIKAIKRAKAAAYMRTLQKQLRRLEAKREDATGEDKFGLTSRIDRKHDAIKRARAALAAVAVALCIVPSGCAHVPTPTSAIETAVIVSEAALEACKGKHSADKWDGSQGARDARESCLQVQDIDRTRDATEALDDAVEAMAAWIKTGA
jgi:hypothetical protein